MPGEAPVDLTDCDREPIHIPGSIQPHGAMLVLDAATYQLQCASANLPALIGRESLSGTTLEELLGREQAHDVRNVLAKSGGGAIADVVMGMQIEGAGAPVDVTVHRHQQRVIVEFEPASKPRPGGNDALDVTQYLIRASRWRAMSTRSPRPEPG